MSAVWGKGGSDAFRCSSEQGNWLLANFTLSPNHPVKLDAECHDLIRITRIDVAGAKALEAKICLPPPVVEGRRQRNGVPVAVADAQLRREQRPKTMFQSAAVLTVPCLYDVEPCYRAYAVLPPSSSFLR